MFEMDELRSFARLEEVQESLRDNTVVLLDIFAIGKPGES